MKKMLLASVIIAGLAIFASCSKNYTCTCTSVEPNGTVIDVTKETISGRESSAEDKCKQRDHVNGNITTTCLID